MKQKMKIRIVKLSNAINRNTGFLIVLTMIIFGLAIVGFQKDNQLILQDTHDTVANTEQLLMQQKRAEEARNKAVEDVINATENQTMILCTLILRGELVVTDEEAVQIERICEEEIQRFQDRGTQSNTSNGTTPTQSGQFSSSNDQQNSQQSDNQPPPDTSPGTTPPSQNETPPQSPPEDRTTIGGFLNDVQKTINNLGCSALGAFCEE